MYIPIESINLQLLNIGYAKHNGDWNWKDVNSPFARIFYVTKGTAKIKILESPSMKEVEYTLRPNYMYIIPAYTRHTYECTGPYELYYLHIYNGFKRETDVFDVYDLPTEVEVGKNTEMAFRTLYEKHPEFTLPASDPRSYDNRSMLIDYVNRYNNLELYEKMEIRGYLLLLFARFMKGARPRIWTQDSRISKVLRYIHNNLFDDIEIDELAEVACLTKPYLIRIFKRDFGTSPLQYINRKKIERAQLILVTEDLPVKEVAYKLGFKDHSYFIRLFKKICGQTPQAYRASMK